MKVISQQKWQGIHLTMSLLYSVYLTEKMSGNLSSQNFALNDPNDLLKISHIVFLTK